MLKLRLVMYYLGMVDLRICKMIASELDIKRTDADKCHKLDIQGYVSSCHLVVLSYEMGEDFAAFVHLIYIVSDRKSVV